ncbi:MAG: hypothetical protein Q4D22_01740 [Candidatus Saccharibacteria bacterium]|nr:hypothetical protein [Candidatus Saccharibacteria bacterium]
MLEIKDILMGANSDSPALNDFARLVAQLLPYRDLAAADMAQIILNATFDVRNHANDYAEEYPNLYNFVRKDGGKHMCQLAASIPTILTEKATDETSSFIQAYQVESIRFFGEPVAYR